MVCDKCKGTGRVRIVLPIPMEIICPKCKGTGKS
ncbi:YuiA family protein [Metabacillus fastidiosus]|nr:YuiA family protein [Metabacillus fastidiosus]MED4452322.1 YuiA family protein [Metabacillus fastidiosus]MED4462309.1 YuiA family protein [Metabacillus fastidiosus]MED4531384.1 YuiA family protein [Metabacillus fastidiosus]